MISESALSPGCRSEPKRCRCDETGFVYASIADAARHVGELSDSVRAAIRMRKVLHGKRWTLVDESTPLTPAEILGQSAAKGSATGRTAREIRSWRSPSELAALCDRFEPMVLRLARQFYRRQKCRIELEDLEQIGRYAVLLALAARTNIAEDSAHFDGFVAKYVILKSRAGIHDEDRARSRALRVNHGFRVVPQSSIATDGDCSESFDSLIPDRASSPLFSDVENREVIDALLAPLRVEEQEIIIEHGLRDRSLAEIAQSLRVSRVAAHGRFVRAMTKLRSTALPELLLVA